jgi:hypothetical protein
MVVKVEVEVAIKVEVMVKVAVFIKVIVIMKVNIRRHNKKQYLGDTIRKQQEKSINRKS